MVLRPTRPFKALINLSRTGTSIWQLGNLLLSYSCYLLCKTREENTLEIIGSRIRAGLLAENDGVEK